MLTGRFFAMTLMASGSLALGVASAEAGGSPCVGQCYEQVATPPVYGAVAEQVMVAPPRTIVHRNPAEFATVPRAVTVRPETTVARHVPAEYSTVAETVMVSPGGKRWVVKPDHHGRMIGCWEETPPKYVTRHRTVVVRPASVYYERTPAITKLVPQHVMVRPPSYSREHIPAEYAVRHRTVMVSPGGVAWQPLGARHHRRHY